MLLSIMLWPQLIQPIIVNVIIIIIIVVVIIIIIIIIIRSNLSGGNFCFLFEIFREVDYFSIFALK